MSDRHGRIARGILSLINVYVTVTYGSGLNNQVPVALSRCKYEDREDSEVEDDITTFEAHDLGLTTEKSAIHEDEEEEDTSEEEVERSYVWDELSYQDTEENSEVTPVSITVTAILDAQGIDTFCKKIVSRKDIGVSRFAES